MDLKISEYNAKLESMVRSNKRLLSLDQEMKSISDRAMKKEGELVREIEKERKFRRDWGGVVDEWKDCIEEIQGRDVRYRFENGNAYRGILEGNIKKMKREIMELKKKVGNVSTEASNIETEYSALMQRYILDGDKKDGELVIVKERLKEMTDLVYIVLIQADRARKETEVAMSKAKEIQHDNSSSVEKFKSILQLKEQEITEILEKSSIKIKSVREQYEIDRSRLVSQVEKLQLQTSDQRNDISRMVRQSKYNEYDPLESLNLSLDLNREKFKRDIGIEL